MLHDRPAHSDRCDIGAVGDRRHILEFTLVDGCSMGGGVDRW